MKTIRSLLLLLAMSVSVSAFAQYIEGTTPLLAPVAPASALDTYASHTEEYGQGGFRSVADATARDAIPADRMKVGMLVHCLDTGTIFRLSASSNWVDSGIKAAGDWVATNLLAVASAEAGRTALGLGEWTTNSWPRWSGDHSSAASLYQDEFNGDAGLRLTYGAYDVMISAGSTGDVKLLSASDGEPLLISSPTAGTLPNWTTLTNDVVGQASTWRERLGLSGGLPDGLLATSSAAQEAAAVGNTELYAADAPPITSTGWTTNGVDWAGFNHASGGGTDPLTLAVGEATGKHTYLLTYTVVGTTSVSLYAVMASIGNSIPQSPYNGGGVAQTFREGLLSISDGNLVFTPVSEFDGYITNISVRRAEGTTQPVLSLRNSADDNVIELRSDSGLDNTYIGKDAGKASVSSYKNTAVGSRAGESLVSGYWNTAVGYESLRDSISGTRNVAVGDYALRVCTTGQRNTAVGSMAGTSLKTGNNNTLIGKDAGYSLTTGSNNVAVGLYALGITPTDTRESVAVGYMAGSGRAPATGYGNTFVGYLAGALYKEGIYNTAIGHGSGYYLSSGDYNTFLGQWSGRYVKSGSRNVMIGRLAGHDGAKENKMSSVDNDLILIGHNATRSDVRPTETPLTNSVAIGSHAQVGANNNFVLGGVGDYAMSVAVGATNAAQSSVLDLNSTTKGFLMPRMTTAQREAISTPAEGLAVWDLTLHKVYYWDATHWTNGW